MSGKNQSSEAAAELRRGVKNTSPSRARSETRARNACAPRAARRAKRARPFGDLCEATEDHAVHAGAMVRAIVGEV